jgi:CDP-diacylglycerol--serine O-phosphatidyltransferase
MDKQKMLLAADTGHFSLIKALHLADLITELNGMLQSLCQLASVRKSC